MDSSRQKVYAFAGNPNGANAVAAPADTSLTAASKVVVNVGGPSNNAVLEGDFNNAYYSGGAFATAFFYVVGNDNTGTQRAALYNFGFADSTFKLNTAVANGPLALSVGNTTGVLASPLTEFFNSRLAKDFMFVGISAACQAQGGSGCIRSLDITSGFPAAANVNNVILNASGERAPSQSTTITSQPKPRAYTTHRSPETISSKPRKPPCSRSPSAQHVDWTLFQNIFDAPLGSDYHSMAFGRAS